MVWGIAPDEPDVLEQFIEDYDITFPILRDPDGVATSLYNQLSSVPAAPYPRDWIVGADGRIAYRNDRLDVPAMIEIIEAELEEAP